ncbi:MAG TPA: RIP metalloprotease RseP [Flavobacteriales bacterium]|nr:RIP metalloprotease RseP [Flavobacteriales bacterium]
MEGLVMTAQLLLGLSILVILHEWGHFITARTFGMRVEKFFLFFDAWNLKLFKFKKGDTEYGIGWLPLGGYVKISGMIDESMDKDAMKKPAESWEFRSKPAWQRLIVMLGGVTVNVLLGMLIFSLMTYRYGEKYLPADQLKYGIVAHELGKQIGLETGDKILSINGEKVERYSDLLASKAYLGSDVVLNVERNGVMYDLPVPSDFIVHLSKSKLNNFIDIRQTFYVKDVLPNSNAAKAGLEREDVITAINSKNIKFFDQFKDALQAEKGKEVELTLKRNSGELTITALVDENGMLGFQRDSKDFEYVTNKFGLIESFGIGSAKAWEMLFLNLKGFGKIFSGEISFSDSVAGPIGIATIYGGTWDWQKFWLITGILSMILAFMNILPIPALDGGHVIFLSIEAITGVKFSDKFMERGQMVGMILLLALMAFVIGNDIWKYILN